MRGEKRLAKVTAHTHQISLAQTKKDLGAIKCREINRYLLNFYGGGQKPKLDIKE
jgi:hypothetical protein